MNDSLQKELLQEGPMQQTVEVDKQQEKAKQISESIKKAVDIVSKKKRRYQMLLMIFFCLTFAQVTLTLLSPALFFMNPIFRCEGSLVSEDEACLKLSESYVGLYCDENKTTRTVIQSMPGFGTIVGLILVNYLSDSKGRKFSIIFSLAVLSLSSIFMLIGAYAKSPIILMISMVFAGFACNNLMLLSYVMSAKFLSASMTTASMMIYNAVWGVTEMTLYFFSTTFREWQILLIIWMVIPVIGLFAVSFILLIEDPIFFFNQKRYKQCKQSLEKVALYNQSEQHLIEAFDLVDFMQKQQSKHTLQQNDDKDVSTFWKQLAPFKNKTIILTIIGLGLFGLGNGVNYYALEYSIQRTGNSFSINVVILGISEIIGCFLTIAIANKLKRISGAVVSSIFQGTIGLLFVFTFVEESSVWQTIIIFMVRLMGTFSYSFYAFLEVQSFPQKIQSLSIGFVELINQLGKFVAPFLVRVSEDNGIDPMITLSLEIFVLCLIPMLLVKETFKQSKAFNQITQDEARKDQISQEERRKETERFSINNL